MPIEEIDLDTIVADFTNTIYLCDYMDQDVVVYPASPKMKKRKFIDLNYD